MNITRGILAEFLVARAVGDTSEVRQAWDNFDALTPTRIRVEVKSAAYLQSWPQRRPSRIVFSGLTGRAWSAQTNELGADRGLRADVYVFALHTTWDPAAYAPLDLRAWMFRALSRERLRQLGRRSISLEFLNRMMVGECQLDELAAAVENSHRENAVPAPWLAPASPAATARVRVVRVPS